MQAFTKGKKGGKLLNQIKYPLKPGQPVNRWLIAGTFEEEKSFRRLAMNVTGDLNRWLTEGFSVFENPSRKEFIDAHNEISIDKIHIPEAFPGKPLLYGETAKKWRLYFPWKNKKVEQSGFWQQPTHLKSWALTHIRSDIEQKVPFRMFTCGSAAVWINGEKVLQFSPYTRNLEKNIQFEAVLKEGDNEFLIFYEDLAERDTLYYFRLDYLGTEPLEMMLPIGKLAADDIHSLENALKGAYFQSDVVKHGDVIIHFENPLKEEVLLQCSFKTEWWGEQHDLAKAAPPGSSEVSFGKVEELGMGNALLKVAIQHGSIAIQKDMFLQLYPEKLVPADITESLLERKEQALSFIARYGSSDIHRAYALVRTGADKDLAESIVRDTLKVINARYDCSDFYLNQLFRFWIDFRETELFEEDFWEECKSAILNYRYWFDEPGDDVMWFFSENHALLFHTCEYLAGQLFPDDIFPNANITGAAHAERAKERLQKWFDKFHVEGLAEWNSSAYIPINAMGFFQIYDLADDKLLKMEAKKALDTTFRLMALNSHNGYLSCSHGRIYEKELKGNYNNATTSLLWIGYGEGNLNNATFAAVSFSISNYEPPEYKSLIHLKPNENIIFKHHQGSEGFVDLYTFKNRYGLLSSAVEYRLWKNGYSEHVIHSILSPEATVWINHPGEEAELGTGRPSFWAGNGILPKVDQYRDIAMVHYKISPENEIAYTHAYFPIAAFDQVKITGKWCFGRIDDSYIAIYAKNGIRLQEEGQNKNRELISEGRDNSWIIRNSHVNLFPAFSDFIDSMAGAEIHADEEGVIFKDPVHGVIHSSWNSPFKVNDDIQSNGNQQAEGVLEQWT
ncbi:hypothetical protein B14911_03514 [Bacillus sp. NRRL B-14911]|nr:hypothetical protein B14911_03514 [Bacillus sp. NRRL B-14911]